MKVLPVIFNRSGFKKSEIVLAKQILKSNRNWKLRLYSTFNEDTLFHRQEYETRPI
jgi:hypothetical protein